MTERPLKILLLDDDEDEFAIVKRLVSRTRRPCDLDWTPLAEEALADMGRAQHDVYLVDYRLGAANGVDVIRAALAAGVKAPLILLTGASDFDGEVDIEALRTGAADYISKDALTAEGLERAMRYALERAQAGALRERLAQEQAARAALENSLAAISAAEARSAASERKFAAMYNAAPFAICLVKLPSTAIADVNPAFVRIFGFSREELVGRTSVELGMQVDLDARQRIVQQLQQNGLVRDVESKVRTKSGKLVVVSQNLDRIDLDGEPYVLGTYQDVTEQRRAEQALQESVREQRETAEKLAEALRLREEFLIIAGHELKTPLAAMLLHLDSLARRSTEYPPKLTERLAKASSAGRRLDVLVHQLLDVSRLTGGRLKLQPEQMDLATLVREVADRFAPQAESTSSQLVLRVPSDAVGCWDRTRLDQVLTNLLANALKYGQGKPIEVELQDAREQVVLRVTDHGIGIAPDNQRRIFGRFERAVATPEYGGFGLGLWIAGQIIEASGGSIDVQSEPGHGATFTVTLPRASAAAA